MPILNVGTNQKLGKRVASYSRPVGPTCPSDCPFLTGVMPDGTRIPGNEKCYAETIEKRYTSVSKNWAQNQNALWASWGAQLLTELRKHAHKLTAVRIHVGGDFVQGDTIDRPYLAALLRTLRKARREGIKTPAWFYTHAWKAMLPYRDRLRTLGVEGFASVHGPLDAHEATRDGWRLAMDCGGNIRDIKPGFQEIHGVRSLTCPEQAKKGKVTCDNCGYCFRPANSDQNRNVTFWRH